MSVTVPRAQWVNKHIVMLVTVSRAQWVKHTVMLVTVPRAQWVKHIVMLVRVPRAQWVKHIVMPVRVPRAQWVKHIVMPVTVPRAQWVNQGTMSSAPRWPPPHTNPGGDDAGGRDDVQMSRADLLPFDRDGRADDLLHILRRLKLHVGVAAIGRSSTDRVTDPYWYITVTVRRWGTLNS